MLKRLSTSYLLALAFAMATIVAACGSMPMGTFNDKAAGLERSIQLVQVASTGLLRAQKISLEQDQQIQANVKLVHLGIVSAKALQPKDPVGAAADLELASKQVDALKTRTGVTP